MSKKPTEAEKKAQHAKFVEAAKAAECDDDEKRFAERVKKVAGSPRTSKRANAPK
jgi:hypothetical protein